MNTLRNLPILPIWVNPQHLATTAAHILAGHRVRALGVLDGNNLVGTIALADLAGAAPDATVADRMVALRHVVDVNTPIREVADLMAREDLDYVPVCDQQRFLGIVTPNMLLREMGQSYDPMSGLSWSDLLRDWGARHLEAGDEITILFIDLNEFGQYNKRHGHVVGDMVIRAVAARLAACIDPSRDVLVRYGGDEFAIGTLRVREEAELLADLIRSQVSGIVVQEGVEPVTFSLGVFGGRRTRERENTHNSATLDNLINMASRAALAAKAAQKKAQARAVVEMAAGPEPLASEFRVVGVYADDQGVRPITTVILSIRDSIVSGAASQVGSTLLESAVAATVKAVERTIPDVAFKVDELRADNGTITLKGRAQRAEASRNVEAILPAGEDPAWTVAQATLEALLG